MKKANGWKAGALAAVLTVGVGASGMAQQASTGSTKTVEKNVAGVGAANQLTKWTDGSGTLGNSSVYDDGTNVGIGTTSPGGVLDVKRSASSDLLMRMWNSGTAGAKLRYVAATGATSQLQLTDNAEWLMAIAGNSAMGMQFRVTTMGGGSSEAILDNSARLTIARTGKVGIGTTSPKSTLQVAGDVMLGSNGTNTDLRIFTDTPGTLGTKSYVQINSITPVSVPGSGTVRTALRLKNATSGSGTNQIDLVVDGNIATKYQDLAEWVPAKQEMAAGTVVILNPKSTNEVMPSVTAYDTRVAGVVSPEPGIILGEGAPTKALIATTGRVRVKVDATKHAIGVGDLLVTSNTSGMAMYSEPVDVGGVKLHRPGTVVGKALEPLTSGRGDILVLLSLQ